ncbi:MAG: CotH kinase family protein [Clostridia bacterium]|nr:CotH kinase family protein [Clostridia bacterium]
MKKNALSVISLILAALTAAAIFASCSAGNETATTEDTTGTEIISAPASFPSVRVTTESGGPIVVREYSPVTVTLEGSEGGRYDFRDLTAQMKCRGNSTFHMPKKPYRIKFDEKINMLGQGDGPSKSWVLLANHSDKSMLRNHVAFAMGKKLDGIGFTSSSSFVQFYMNDVYFGVYELVEHHGEGKYRIVMSEDPKEPDTDYLVELDEYVNINGGDIPYTFDVRERAFSVKSDSMTMTKWRFIREFFAAVDDAVADGDESAVRELIDVPSFVDMYLLHEIAMNSDVGSSSFFFLKKAGGKLYCTCPWDFDIAFGNDEAVRGGSWEGIFAGNPDFTEGISGYDTPRSNDWFSWLMKRRWFVDLVAERWDGMKDELEETALAAIDEALGSWEDEMNKNFEKWKILNRRIIAEADETLGFETWRENAEYLREWIVNRFEWLDGYFSDPGTRYQTVSPDGGR